MGTLELRSGVVSRREYQHAALPQHTSSKCLCCPVNLPQQYQIVLSGYSMLTSTVIICWAAAIIDKTRLTSSKLVLCLGTSIKTLQDPVCCCSFMAARHSIADHVRLWVWVNACTGIDSKVCIRVHVNCSTPSLSTCDVWSAYGNNCAGRTPEATAHIHYGRMQNMHVCAAN